MTNRNRLSALGAIAIALVGVTVWAAPNAGPQTAPDSRAYLHSYNLPSAGIAIEGYCPVAYFAADKAIKGNPAYPSDHNGVTYHFVSADAKSLFDANPEQYLPAYGGWCAFGMSIGDKFPIDPYNFKIVDGRLLLFLRNANVDARRLWNDSDQGDSLTKAGAHWKKVAGK